MIYLLICALFVLVLFFEKKYSTAQKENTQYRIRLAEYYKRISMLNMELYDIKRKKDIQAQHGKDIPTGTIEAVKFAMVKSHPDNGGNIEDFIKYRNVYEKLTRKGG